MTVLVALCALPVRAELLEIDLEAPGDGLVTRDSESGLDWLDLTESTGFSFAEIEAGAGGFLADGWRHARTDEVCALVDEARGQAVPCPGVLVGILGFPWPLGVTVGEEAFGTAIGAFADETPGDERVGFARVRLNARHSSVSVVPDQLPPLDASDDVGHFLVRPAEGPSSVQLVFVQSRPRHWPARGRFNPPAVAVQGSEEVDVRDIDLESLAFQPSGEIPLHELERSRALGRHTRDVNRDGYPDLLVHFDVSEVGVGFADREICLSLRLLGQPFLACVDVPIGPRPGDAFVTTPFQLVYVDPESGRQAAIWTHEGDRSLQYLALDGREFAYITDARGHAVVRVDLALRAAKVVAEGGFLRNATGIAIERGGTLLVGSFDQTLETVSVLVRIDPETGSQMLLASGGLVENPRGMRVDGEGNLVVGQLNGPVLRVDTASGEVEVFVDDAPGGAVFNPFDVTFEPDGDLLIANDRAGGRATVLRVQSAGGEPVEVSADDLLHRPMGIALARDGRILVTDFQRLVAVDAITGEQSLLASGDLLIGNPIGVAVVEEPAPEAECRRRPRCRNERAAR